MGDQEIPIVILKKELTGKAPQFSSPVLANEIDGIYIEHVAVKDEATIIDVYEQGYATIYLFLLGRGNVVVKNKKIEAVPESILLPNSVEDVIIKAAEKSTLHYLKIRSRLTEQDLTELQGFPSENTGNEYFAKFKDCQSYSEPIKSPNTISRTILPNKYIPRIAMGTVQTKGPDAVGAHEHPMLEQLFLGLTKNKCTVYADGANVDFPEYSLLHIPLGSRHSVSVEDNEVMHYVWMDFFLDSKGEEWLKTHIIDDESK